MLCVAPGCELDVQRGPDWLIVRVVTLDEESSASLGDQLWSLLERHMTYRLVLELDAVPRLDASLVAQLICLDRRIAEHGGMLRLCGLSPYNCKLLRAEGFDRRLPAYRDRQEAILGCRPPRQPK